jgi:hypothetical protein
LRTRPNQSVRSDLRTRPNQSVRSDLRTRPNQSVRSDLRTRPNQSVRSDLRARAEESVGSDLCCGTGDIGKRSRGPRGAGIRVRSRHQADDHTCWCCNSSYYPFKTGVHFKSLQIGNSFANARSFLIHNVLIVSCTPMRRKLASLQS